MATIFPFLLELVGSAGLPPHETRRMFGCDAFFVDGEIFALIWKTGRIGVKLTEAGEFAALAALPGAEPWCAGPKAMAHWLLTPEEFHDDPEALAPWLKRAHAEARGRASGAMLAPVKKVAKAPAAKKATKARAKKAAKRVAAR